MSGGGLFTRHSSSRNWIVPIVVSVDVSVVVIVAKVAEIWFVIVVGKLLNDVVVVQRNLLDKTLDRFDFNPETKRS